MSRWLRPSGRRVLVSVGVFVVLLLASNVAGTLFWQFTGGVGLLDLDGGANLTQPDTAQPFPPKATGDRVLAILAAYGPEARLLHVIALFSLDLIFPAAVAAMCWVALAWACGRRDRDAPRWCLVGAGALALAYLTFDWGENLIELLLLSGVRGGAVDLLPIVSTVKMWVFAVVVAAMAATAVLRAGRTAGSAAGVEMQ